MVHQAGAYPGFVKQLGAFLLPPRWDAGPSQGYPPSIKFASTHIYTWVERGTERPRAQTYRSGDEYNNQEATAPLTQKNIEVRK